MDSLSTLSEAKLELMDRKPNDMDFNPKTFDNWIC